MKKSIVKFLFTTVAVVLAAILLLNYINFKNNIRGNLAFADSEKVGSKNYYVDSEWYIPNIQDINISPDLIQAMYDRICEVEENVDISSELTQAKYNYDLPDDSGYIPSLEEYQSDIDAAEEYYSQNRWQVDYAVNGVMTCSFWDWIKNVVAVIISIFIIAEAAADFVDDYLLAGELLLHSGTNNVLDSVYHPVNIDPIKQSPTYQSILNGNSTDENNKFTTETDGLGLFLAMHSFHYYKTENNSAIEICDRYDFEHNENYQNDVIKTLNEVGAISQDIGLITPYQIVIDFTNPQSGNVVSETSFEVDGCSESVITLGKGDVCVMDLTVVTDGYYTIQTFGTKETEFELYQGEEYKGTYSGGGYLSNAFFCHYLSNGYLLSLRFKSKYCAGTTKLVIAPYCINYDFNSGCYNDFFRVDSSSFLLVADLYEWNGDVNLICPQQDGYYKFNIETEENMNIYIFDPRSARTTVEITNEPNNAEEAKCASSISVLNSIENKVLTKDIPYFVAVVREYGEISDGEYRLTCTTTDYIWSLK